MLIILSPAKALADAPNVPGWVKPSAPVFEKEAEYLAGALSELSQEELVELMHISPKLAMLNAKRYKNFATTAAYPCMWMFRGDAYKGFDIESLSKEYLPALQKRLRILSGLYGVLRPFDAMHPYRLEMGTRFENDKGKNLYEFWNDRISKQLNKAADEIDTDILLNLASQEYSGAVRQDALKPKMITVHFKEQKGDQFKVIGIHAKKARGLFTRWVIENQVKKEAELKDFDAVDYTFRKTLSDDTNLVFAR